MDNTTKVEDWEQKALSTIHSKQLIRSREKKKLIDPANDQMSVLYNFSTGQIQKVAGNLDLILGKVQITAAMLYRNESKLIFPPDFYMINRYRQLLPRIIGTPEFPLHESKDYYQINFRLNTNPLQSIRRKCYLYKQGDDLILHDIWEKIQPIEYVQASFFHKKKQNEINRFWFQLNLESMPFLKDQDLKLLYYFSLDYLEKEIADILSISAKAVENRKTKLFAHFDQERKKIQHEPQINSRVKLVQVAKQLGVLPINDDFLAALLLRNEHLGYRENPTPASISNPKKSGYFEV